jgi:hypothetical protein
VHNYDQAAIYIDHRVYSLLLAYRQKLDKDDTPYVPRSYQSIASVDGAQPRTDSRYICEFQKGYSVYAETCVPSLAHGDDRLVYMASNLSLTADVGLMRH